MHSWLRHLHLAKCCLIALMLLTCTAAQTAYATVVRVGVFDNAPKLMLSPDGQITGIVGELLQEIAREEKWELQAVACEWQDCLKKLNENDIDLLPDVAHTAERNGLFSYHKVPSVHNWSQVYAKRGARLSSVLDLNGKHIVALADSVQQQFTDDLISSFGISARLTGVATQEAGFIMVAGDEADAVVASYYYGEIIAPSYDMVATAIMFAPTRSYYVTKLNQNQALLDAIDKHLSRWQQNPESVYFTILRQWGKPSDAFKMPPIVWWGGAALILLLALASGIAALLKKQVSRQTRHLKAREIWLDTVLQSVDAFIYIKDTDYRYKYCNYKALDFFGLQPSEMIGLTDHQLFPGQAVLTEIEESDYRVITEGGRVVSENQLVAIDGTTQARMFLTVKLPLLDAMGRLGGICGICTDITPLNEARQKVHQLAYYDPLTTLPNKSFLMDRLEIALGAATTKQAPSAILLLDLDHFKKLNDARGHLRGDILLQRVAERLQSIIQPHDVVARIGGDEFAMLLTNLDPDNELATRQAMQTAEKIRATLEQSYDIEGQPFWSTASIGVALLTEDEKGLHDLLREADTAMYRAKSLGRNQVSLYERHMQQEVEERLSLEHDIAQAINDEQFQMYVQAQFDRNKDVVGAELLIRWEHPVRGMVPPALFIPVAEQTRAISQIGEWTIYQACLALTQSHLAQANFPLSINVSPTQFREPNFPQRVKQILAETQAPANRLLFEITEGVLIDNFPDALTTMEELQDMGIRFSIDDFGTGYSNLSSLKKLPLFELKIDQSLIHGTEPGSTVIVKMIVALAHHLGMQVVAEGVETQEQVDFLTRNGCDAMQGYLFMRPIPLKEWTP